MKSILLTAFEPFDNEPLNPSFEVSKRIGELTFNDLRLTVLQLPVDRERAIDRALTEIRHLSPDIVMMLGEAHDRFRITPERIAINVDDYRIPDNAGNQPVDEPILADAPAGYLSTLPIRAIVNRLIVANIPAKISNSAGTYLCNRLFYCVMHAIATQSLPVRAGFIHLPRMHEQAVNKREDMPSLSLTTLIEGIQLAIEVTRDSVSKTED